MSRTFTTSDGSPGDFGLDWIYDPETEDGFEAGLLFDTSAMTADDILDALRLEAGPEREEGAGHDWPLSQVETALKRYGPKIEGDDYLEGYIEKLKKVIENGKQRGATHLLLC